jgi:hypothetical protein
MGVVSVYMQYNYVYYCDTIVSIIVIHLPEGWSWYWSVGPWVHGRGKGSWGRGRGVWVGAGEGAALGRTDVCLFVCVCVYVCVFMCVCVYV